MSRRLADIVRTFDVEPDAIRLASRRNNTHWRVRAGDRFYALRRFGVWGRTTPGDVAWEVAAVQALAAIGAPVPRPIAAPREIDGQVWLLMPWLPGRTMRGQGSPPTSAEYRRLGVLLAEFHATTADLAAPAQRPGFGLSAEGASPEPGGASRRDQLLAALGTVEPAMARRFRDAAETLAARDLPRRLADCPQRIVHGDFSTWNLRVAGGRLVGVLDFELAHVDIRAADLAYARRGYHDAVVDGYLSHTSLSDAEIDALDGLWLGGFLNGLWRVLENRIAEGSDLAYGLGWYLEQLDKTRPYQA